MFARNIAALSLVVGAFVAGCGQAAPTKLDCSTNPVGCICADDTNCGGENPRCDNHTGRCVPCLMFNDNCTGGARCLYDGAKYYCAMGCLKSSDCPKVGGVQQQCCDKACVDVTSTVAHCGACGAACKELPNTTAACVGGGCTIGKCADGYDNCDGKADNGCETPIQSDPKHCGKCGGACVVGSNATPVCSAGKCGAVCNSGYADCDGNLANGCETSVTSDPKNCGTCGVACGPLPNAGNSTCVAGKCVPSACAGWFGDCDKDPANGCESDMQSDAKNCGACGMACPAAANGTNACVSGVCGIGKCNAGFGDCDRDPKTGCEKALSSDANNCGACGVVCAGANSLQECQQGACVVSACNGGGFNDCDKDPKNGCEVNILSDIKNCNGCGMACPAPANAEISCKLGVCGVGACKTGYADCDKDPATGCEVDIGTLNNCGGCGIMCPVYANASNQCLGGKCTLKTCNMGFENCNNNAGDGCEVNLVTDPKNCGICGVACNYRNASGACAAGKCSMGACNAGFADCNKNDVDGCEQDVSSDPKNCGACGNVCPNNAPNCVNSKCSNSVHASKPWQGFNSFGAWGCFSNAGGGYPDDLDWMELSYYGHTWKACMLEASKYGAMAMAPVDADWDSPGWYGHRNAGNAMIGEYWGYSSAAIGGNQTCVVARPRLSQKRTDPLKSAISYDGNAWSYTDFGNTTYYFYECFKLAADSGATMITPYTIGLNGTDYWLGMVDICAQTCWNTGGSSYSCEYPYDPDVGTKHRCMIGYMDN